MTEQAHVVIVGGGFAGIGCAHELAKHPHHARVTLIDRHDYHQFLPLLYQVATFQLAGRRRRGWAQPSCTSGATAVEVVAGARSTSADPAARAVTLDDGRTIEADYLVLAAGSQANFFGTPGVEHAFPLYSLDDARRLRARILAVVRGRRARPARSIDAGGLTFVVVGAGATGTEVAGALADLIRDVMPSRFHEPRPGDTAASSSSTRARPSSDRSRPRRTTTPRRCSPTAGSRSGWARP